MTVNNKMQRIRTHELEVSLFMKFGGPPRGGGGEGVVTSLLDPYPIGNSEHATVSHNWCRFILNIYLSVSKAYIPPEHKILGVGGWRWAVPPMPEFCVGDTNMLVSWSQRKPWRRE